MRTPVFSLHAASASLSLILLAPCAAESHRSPSVPVPLRQTEAFPNVAGPRYAYISDPYGNFVDEFDRAGRLAAKVTSGISGPVGLYVDSSHNLWVANASGNNVLMFAEGATTPSRTLQDPGAIPGDVTLGTDGTAYVANILNASGPGSILVYPPGHDKATRQLQDPRMSENLFISIDQRDDLFVTTATKVLGQFVGRVDEYVGARQSGLRRFHIKLGSPGGIKWRNGMLYVCDTTEHTVTEYTEAGRATGRKLVTGGAWDGIDFSPDGTMLLGADQTYIQGIAREFPRGRIRRIYSDPLFQSPVGAAFQTDQGGL